MHTSNYKRLSLTYSLVYFSDLLPMIISCLFRVVCTARSKCKVIFSKGRPTFTKLLLWFTKLLVAIV